MESVQRQPTVFAVVVTYRPDLDRLAMLLQALAPQVSAIVIINNGGDASAIGELVRSRTSSACILVTKKRNIGLAAAQNEGIDLALRGDARYVLLLDDDSVPGVQMVARLVAALESVADTGEKVAAAGPVFTDDRSGHPSHFVRFGVLGFRRVRCDAAGPRVVNTDALISSGMLLPAPALREVGLMDESLFIDHVDTEWCLRAQSLGYRMLGVCDARLSHRLGEGSRPLLGGLRLFQHPPIRRYFIFRNSVLLYRRRYPLLRWKIADARRLLVMLVAILFLSPPRLKQVRAAFSGVIDGLRGRSGPLPVGRSE